MSPIRLLLLAALCCAQVARAQDPPPSDPAGPEADAPMTPPESAAIPAPTQPAAAAPALAADAAFDAPVPEPFRTSSWTPFASVGIGSGLSGDYLVGELGLQAFWMRAFDRKWLLSWDASAALRLGGLGNEHPYFFFIGGAAHSIGEVGRRLFSDNAWAPYISGRIQGHISAMAQPGQAISELDTINNSQGFGGLIVDGSFRLSAGASFLDSRHSFVVTIFLQEALRAPEGIAGGTTLTEGGLSVRYDISESFALYIEGIYGASPSHFSSGLNTHDTTMHIQAQGFLRKLFKNGVWVGLALSYGRDTDVLSFDGGGSYSTANPPDFALTALFGVPIGVKL